MTLFHAEKLREGKTGSDYYKPRVYVVLTGIDYSPEDTVLTIPSHFPEWDEPLTHIGYREKFSEGYEKWVDWHHPSKGCEYVHPRYDLLDRNLKIPPYVKKIVIPETVSHVSDAAFADAVDVIFEVHPDNPYLTVVDNKIVRKPRQS